jgi:hypothetical protein
MWFVVQASEIDRGLFDGAGYDCKFHGRFRVSRAVLAQGKKRTRRQWEHALMPAKARVCRRASLECSPTVVMLFD